MRDFKSRKPPTSIQYHSGRMPSLTALCELYEDAGWISYTKRPANLKKAVEGSRIVITAWDGELLVGLVRGVGDGQSIMYVQDILVKKTYQRQGIGRAMMEMLFSLTKQIRQKVLIADQSVGLRKFYESLGMQSQDVYNTVAFMIFEQLV